MLVVTFGESAAGVLAGLQKSFGCKNQWPLKLLTLSADFDLFRVRKVTTRVPFVNFVTTRFEVKGVRRYLGHRGWSYRRELVPR